MKRPGKARMMRRKKSRSGFTLFEAIVAIFILLVGVMGIASVFSAGMRVRMISQELIVSKELATMWSDWVRFGLESEGLSADQTISLSISKDELVKGAEGDFYDDTAKFGGNNKSMHLPTHDRNVYQGYTWEIKSAEMVKPKWIPENGTEALDWDKRLDKTSLYAWAVEPDQLKEVVLAIRRGGRRYEFTYLFSGVGMRYNDINK